MKRVMIACLVGGALLLQAAAIAAIIAATAHITVPGILAIAGFILLVNGWILACPAWSWMA